jgi:hypothetical protein
MWLSSWGRFEVELDGLRLPYVETPRLARREEAAAPTGRRLSFYCRWPPTFTPPVSAGMNAKKPSSSASVTPSNTDRGRRADAGQE